jgi:transposase-like protein
MVGQSEAFRKRGPSQGQHFLLSAAAHSLSLIRVARLTDDQAFRLFKRLRWIETNGAPICPHCDCLAVYEYKSRRIFSCKACTKQFSVTSGTIFHNRKLPITTILFAIAIFTNGAKGHSALQLSRDLRVQYKTAFVLLHKIREALGAEIDERTASGVVEVDGAYFGGHIRPANWAENRVDRRLAKHQTGKRQVVIIMRERNGRSMPFVVKYEHHAVPTLAKRIIAGSVVHADEARSWDALYYEGVDMKRINHEECYSDDDACTNNAESFFSRLRRAEIGTHHHIAGPYLGAYAHEMAWREDTRRINNGVQFLLIGLAALTNPPSEQWQAYWQKRGKGLKRERPG